MIPRRSGSRRARKNRDRAVVLVLVGLLLLMPPAAGIFHVDTKIFSIPGTLIYLFMVWALLIVAAAGLAPALNSDVAEADDTEADVAKSGGTGEQTGENTGEVTGKNTTNGPS